MIRRLQRAWRATEHPFLARVGGLMVVITLVTGGAAIAAGFIVGVLDLATNFRTSVLVVILVGVFLVIWGLLAQLAARVHAARTLPRDLRSFAKRLFSDRMAQVEGAPRVLTYPGPERPNEPPERQRYRREYRRSQRRRDRYFASMRARYARVFRIEALELLERVERTPALSDEEIAELQDGLAHDPGDAAHELARAYEDVADRVEAVPLVRRLRG